MFLAWNKKHRAGGIRTVSRVSPLPLVAVRFGLGLEEKLYLLPALSKSEVYIFETA